MSPGVTKSKIVSPVSAKVFNPPAWIESIILSEPRPYPSLNLSALMSERFWLLAIFWAISCSVFPKSNAWVLYTSEYPSPILLKSFIFWPWEFIPSS